MSGEKALIFEEERFRNERMAVAATPYDSDYFGLSCGKAALTGPLTPEDTGILRDKCAEFSLTTLTNYGNDPSNNVQISRMSGAFLADVNIQFSKRVAPEPEPCTSPFEIILGDTLDPAPGIVEIAATAFHHSRFLNDPFLPKDKAASFYAHIVEDSFGRSDKHFAYALFDGQICGFWVCFLNPGAGRLTIQLCATHPAFQRRGVFSALRRAVERKLAGAGMREIQVGTQAENFGAISNYLKNGFAMTQVSSVYHLWNRQE